MTKDDKKYDAVLVQFADALQRCPLITMDNLAGVFSIK